MTQLAFKPKTVTKKLIQHLPERSRDVIASRYALSGQKKPETLDSIGKRYGVTRERVRQIENHAIKLIQESEALVQESDSFAALEEAISNLGGILPEHLILKELAHDEESKNNLYFLLVVGHSFIYAKEDKDFSRRWYVDENVAKAVENALKAVHQKVRPTDVLTEHELVEHVKACLDRVSAKYREHDTILRWLELSQCLVKNPLNEWGRATAPGIKVKNIRDYAYLAMKRQGEPMHFREIAQSIRESFGKKAHEATTHNELIKDPRFVLVGRGKYALSDWGYEPGTVADVIVRVLAKRGPLSKNQILDEVKKHKFVKDNTVMVNLQNVTKFVKGKDGKYSLKK